MDQLPTRGWVEAQLTLPPSGLAGQARSFLPCPLWPGSGRRGGGWASQKATPAGRVRPSSIHFCNFCFGHCASNVSAAQTRSCSAGFRRRRRSLRLFFFSLPLLCVPSSTPTSTPAPWRPQPSLSPASTPLAPCQALSQAARAGMEAETQGQGRGGSPPWGLCARASPPPPLFQSLPTVGALSRVTPGLGKIPVVSSPKPERGKAPRACDFCPESWGRQGTLSPLPLSLRMDLKLTLA